MESIGLLETLKETPGFYYYEPGDKWYYEDDTNHIAFPIKNIEGRIVSFYCIPNYDTRIYSTCFVNGVELENSKKPYIFTEDYQPTDEEGYNFGIHYNTDIYLNYMPGIALVDKDKINENSTTIAIVYSIREFYYLAAKGFNVIFDNYLNNVEKNVVKKVINKIKYTRGLNIQKVIIYFSNQVDINTIEHLKKALGVEVEKFVDDSVEWDTFNQYCTKKKIIPKNKIN